MDAIYLPKTSDICNELSSVNAISIAEIEKANKRHKYDVYVSTKKYSFKDIKIKKCVKAIVCSALDDDGLSSKTCRIVFCEKDVKTNVEIVNGIQVYSFKGLKAIQDYIDRKSINTRVKKRGRFFKKY